MQYNTAFVPFFLSLTLQQATMFSDQRFLVPGTSADENANENEASEPRIELPLKDPDDTGSYPTMKGHAGIKAATSLPLTPERGTIHGPIAYLRQRSRSETLGLPTRPASGDVSYIRREVERDRTGSVKGLLEDAFIDEGVSITLDDPLVRVAEQEIAEAFDVSEDELHEAAERILADGTDREDDKESYTEEEDLGDDRTTAEVDSSRSSPNVSSRWSGGIQSAPERELVITDL